MKLRVETRRAHQQRNLACGAAVEFCRTSTSANNAVPHISSVEATKDWVRQFIRRHNGLFRRLA
jgi:hypothetical protein